MKNGGIELIGLMEMEDRSGKKRLIRAIFGPAIVPFVHVGVMEFVACGFELVPLNPGMEDIQNVVKDFVEREFGLWPFCGSFQMGVDISIKVFTRDFSWNPMEDECRVCSFDLGIHHPILPDEGDSCESQTFSYYPFILRQLCQNLTMSSLV